MTTEEDFQLALDANPDDFHSRLVFADFLQDRDDPRTEGYRAMGLLRIRPSVLSSGRSVITSESIRGELAKLTMDKHGCAIFPNVWFDAVCVSSPTRKRECFAASGWKFFETRTLAENRVAEAFAKLTPEQRDEILNQPLFAKNTVGSEFW